MNQLPPELAQQFEVAQPIAQGRTGVVVRAVRRSTGQSGVLKVLHPELVETQDAHAQWMGELKRQAALASPRLAVPMLWGEAGGTVWLFRPWVEGHSLKRIVEAQGVPKPEASRAIVTAIAQALDALHLNGLLHRDLKPGHVICDSRGEAVVIDAGSSAPIDPAAFPGLRGTAGYLAPEVVAGEPPTARSDLYALGCLWFELVTGRRPFAASDVASELDAHAHRPIPPLPQNADASLIASLLHKDPTARPGSAQQVLGALHKPTEPAPHLSDPLDEFSGLDDATMQLDLADLLSGSEFEDLRTRALAPNEFEEQRTTAQAPSSSEFQEQRTTAQAPGELEFQEQPTVSVETSDASDFEDMRTQAVALPDQNWEQASTMLYDRDDPHSARPVAMTTSPAPESIEASARRVLQPPEPEPAPTAPAPAGPVPAPRLAEHPAAPAEGSDTYVSEHGPMQSGGPQAKAPSLVGVWFFLFLLVGAAGAFVYVRQDPMAFDPFGMLPEDIREALSPTPVPPPVVRAPPPAKAPAPVALDVVAVPTPKPDDDSAELPDGDVDAPAKPSSRTHSDSRDRDPSPVQKPPPEADDEEFAAARDAARTAYGAGDWVASEAAYLRASQLNPKNAGVLAGLGTARLRQRNIKGAINAFEQAVTVAPDNANFWAALGRAYRIDGQRESSESAYRRTLELDPDNTYALEALGVKPIE